MHGGTASPTFVARAVGLHAREYSAQEGELHQHAEEEEEEEAGPGGRESSSCSTAALASDGGARRHGKDGGDAGTQAKGVRWGRHGTALTAWALLPDGVWDG